MNVLACAQCGSPNPASAKFCNECAASVVGSGGIAETPAPSPTDRNLPPAFAAVWGFIRGGQTGLRSLLRTTIITVSIVAFVWAVYYASIRLDTYGGFENFSIRWEQPVVCCQFYANLADAMNHGTLDLTKVGLGAGQHTDLQEVDGKVYLPYAPTPAVVLMPLVAVWGLGLTQSNASVFLGAASVGLFYHILRLLGVSRQTKFLLIPFFAFGTQNFFNAATGSLWFYNHTVAAFFLMLGLVFLLRRDNPILPALALGAAALSREATVLAAPAFVYLIIEQRRPGTFSDLPAMLASLVLGRLSSFRHGLKQFLNSVRNLATDKRTVTAVSLFLISLVPFAAITLWYNDVRFGSMFDSGLLRLYDEYEGVPYTAYLATWPSAERFAEFDLRNIPLHLYTIFLMPPSFEPSGTLFKPNEYGTSVLITSSPLAYAIFVKRKDAIKTACWIGLLLVSIPTLTYYAQGWVQFGYRYIADYLPFLMILTAFGFEDNRSPAALRLKIILVFVSIVIGFWGRWWGNYE
jgi:hypothetical protein